MTNNQTSVDTTGISLFDFVQNDSEKFRRKITRKGFHSIEQYRLDHDNYQSYLRSTLWKNIRLWVLNRDAGSCQICRSDRQLEVHHRRYDSDTLYGRTDQYLVTLCGSCHRQVEHHADGTRRPNQLRKDEEIDRLKGLYERKDREGVLFSLYENDNEVGVEYAGDVDILEIFSLIGMEIIVAAIIVK